MSSLLSELEVSLRLRLLAITFSQVFESSGEWAQKNRSIGYGHL